MVRWTTLEHNGIHFPPLHEFKGIKLKIKGEPISLTHEQEEMIYQWAKKKDTQYVEDSVFQRNFTNDFAQTLETKFRNITYQDIDFENAYDLVDKEKKKKEAEKKKERREREKIKSLPPDERKLAREKLAAKRKRDRAAKNKEKERLKAHYGTAFVDGQPVDVASYMAEPPGIFIGRGNHPLRGKWKPRITSNDVTLNLGKGAKTPVGIDADKGNRDPDSNWKAIVHNQDATWLASWTDFLTGKTKYVWLADTAGLKQERDKEKYEKAKRLETEIEKIKDQLVKDMSKGDKTKIATVCYLIYRTAMRVGDEKDADEADTVGATTLRKEHITITNNTIKFDFLGKDSIPWQETLNIQEHDKQFQKNLKKLMTGKKPYDQIFDDINSRRVNAYYSGIVKGLTAKVFRTYLATDEVKKYLLDHDDIHKKSEYEKLYHAKLANLQAAMMCNHKRTIPKNFDEKLKERDDKLVEIREEKPWAKSEAELETITNIAPKTDKQKKIKNKRLAAKRKQIKEQKRRHKVRTEKLGLQLDLAKKTRDYNLGTSLRNYIDPRVFKAWTNEVGVEWERLYTAALQKKFLWVRNEDVKWSEIKSSKT